MPFARRTTANIASPAASKSCTGLCQSVDDRKPVERQDSCHERDREVAPVDQRGRRDRADQHVTNDAAGGRRHERQYENAEDIQFALRRRQPHRSARIRTCRRSPAPSETAVMAGRSRGSVGHARSLSSMRMAALCRLLARRQPRPRGDDECLHACSQRRMNHRSEARVVVARDLVDLARGLRLCIQIGIGARRRTRIPTARATPRRTSRSPRSRKWVPSRVHA